MSLEELQAQGLLLAEEHWGEIELKTPVNKRAIASTFCLAALAIALMVIGQGRSLTWVGAALFVLFLLLFTIVSSRGIDRQSRRLQGVADGSRADGADRGASHDPIPR